MNTHTAGTAPYRLQKHTKRAHPTIILRHTHTYYYLIGVIFATYTWIPDFSMTREVANHERNGIAFIQSTSSRDI